MQRKKTYAEYLLVLCITLGQFQNNVDLPSDTTGFFERDCLAIALVMYVHILIFVLQKRLNRLTSTCCVHHVTGLCMGQLLQMDVSLMKAKKKNVRAYHNTSQLNFT